MIWLFERGHEDLLVETVYDNVAGQYVLTIRHPDGRQSVERYPNTHTLEARLTDLEAALEAERWCQQPKASHLKDSWRL